MFRGGTVMMLLEVKAAEETVNAKVLGRCPWGRPKGRSMHALWWKRTWEWWVWVMMIQRVGLDWGAWFPIGTPKESSQKAKKTAHWGPSFTATTWSAVIEILIVSKLLLLFAVLHLLLFNHPPTSLTLFFLPPLSFVPHPQYITSTTHLFFLLSVRSRGKST